MGSSAAGTALAFVFEVPVHGEPRLCVELPGDDGIAFTGVLERGHVIPADALGLRYDPALQPLAFVTHASGPAHIFHGGKRLARFRAAPTHCFAPYRAVPSGDAPPWDDPLLTSVRHHEASVIRSAGDGLYRKMLDTGFLQSWRIWPWLKLATRRAISEALALDKSAHDPERVGVLRRYVVWLNRCDEQHGVIDTVSREHLCPAIDALAEGMGLPRLPTTWADPWRDW